MQSPMNLGADVDSRYVWVARAGCPLPPQRIDNTRPAIRTWLRNVPQGSRLAMESTGVYHELLAELAHKAGLQVFVINPRDLRRYSEAIGGRAKTDRVDAAVIARYIDREHAALHPYVISTAEQRSLSRLIRRRAKLVQIKGSLAQSLRGLRGVRHELEQLTERIDRLIARLELLMRQTLQRMPSARAAAEHIATIPGFGDLTSTCLAHSFTRLPYSTSDAVVAASGLDPRAEDSGRKRGRRRLSKRGPSEQRRLIFNCARAAARTTVWKPYYQAQLAKGLSATAATVILGRKMLRVAFALCKTQRPFDPTQRFYAGHQP